MGSRSERNDGLLRPDLDRRGSGQQHRRSHQTGREPYGNTNRADTGHLARILVTEIEHKVSTTRAHWMPGARELLIAANQAGIPVAVVSNSWRVLLDLLMHNIDVPVDLTVSSTEVERPKPDPQPFLYACEQLRVNP